jgi:hypothetical protein
MDIFESWKLGIYSIYSLHTGSEYYNKVFDIHPLSEK